MLTESPPILHTVDMTWPDFCQRYQTAQPEFDSLFAKAEKEFRQYCNPTILARTSPPSCGRKKPTKPQSPFTKGELNTPWIGRRKSDCWRVRRWPLRVRRSRRQCQARRLRASWR